MKIKKIFLSMLLMIVAICFCPTKVFATSTIERTTTLDVSKFIQDEENKEEGWSWNSTTNTLTLTNVNFNTGDNMSIVLPSDRDIHIVSNGNNKLISSKTVIYGKKDGPGFIIFGGNGLLELNSKKELPTIDANDLLFESGTVNAIGGSIITMQTIKVDGGYAKVDTSQVSDDGWTDGLYACGSIEISSGTVDIISNRVGIFATGTGHPNPTTGIKITGGNIDVSAKLYGMCSGNNTYKKDVYIETTGTIDFKDSSIGIALANGNLTIKKGMKYAVVGHSGAGKSTLFKLIMGYEKNSSGVIRLDGEDIRNYDISELISYTDQNEHIYRAGIVDNITVFHSYPMDGIDSVGKSIWPELFEGIFNRKEKECQRFSGGEKQAVAFLRMAAKNAEVILLDEPFSAMDAKMKSAVEHYLFTGKEFEGKTVLVITHDTREESLSQYDGIIHVGENGIYVE